MSRRVTVNGWVALFSSMAQAADAQHSFLLHGFSLAYKLCPLLCSTVHSRSTLKLHFLQVLTLQCTQRQKRRHTCIQCDFSASFGIKVATAVGALCKAVPV